MVESAKTHFLASRPTCPFGQARRRNGRKAEEYAFSSHPGPPATSRGCTANLRIKKHPAFSAAS
jgi:hypothetical protein